MPSRITFFYECFRNGWTENWIVNSEDGQAVMNAAVGIGGYVDLRRAFLANTCFVRYVRVCNTDQRRDSIFKSYNGDTGKGQMPAVPGGQQAEQAWDAVNVRFFAGNTHWRALLFRGLPTLAYDANGQLRGAGAFIDALGLLRIWIHQRYNLRTLFEGNAALVQNIGIGADRRIRSFTLDAAIGGLVDGDTIRLSGNLTTSNANGNYRLRSTGNAGLLLRVAPKRQNNIRDPLLLIEGRVTRLIQGTPQVTASQVVGTTSRKTGRPSYSPAGRARVRQG